MFLIATGADIASFFLQLLNYSIQISFHKKESFIKNFIMILYCINRGSNQPCHDNLVRANRNYLQPHFTRSVPCYSGYSGARTQFY